MLPIIHSFAAMPKKAKRVSTTALIDLVTRSLLIVLSIMLALFLDGIWEQQKVTTDLNAAYLAIHREVESNRDALASAVEYHRQSVAAMDSLLDNRVNASEFSGFLSEALPKGPELPYLQNAAWNTFHSTGLTTHLKFDDVYPLTMLYASQTAGVERSSQELAQFIAQPERFEIQYNATSLKGLKSRLNELYEQEKRLLAETNTVLNAGQNWRYLE